MADTKRFRLGGAEVVFDSVTLQVTNGVEIEEIVDTADVFLDETGTDPQDTFITGGRCKVTVSIGKHSLDTLAKVFPNVVQVGTGDTSRLEFRSRVGTSLRDSAKKMVIKPYVGGVASTDTSDWYVVPLAAPTGGTKWGYKVKDQVVFPVTFVGFPDSTHNNRHSLMGDELYS